jgi:hypothetical protein
MIEEQVSFVNGIRTIDISKNGLYAPWPIPAAKVLAHNKEWAALHVLSCLVTYLGHGKSSNLVYPTIKTICESTGHGKATVQKGINQLVRYGFIVKEKRAAARFKRNYYQILSACYDYGKMNDYATIRFPPRKEMSNHLVKNQITTEINPESIQPTYANQVSNLPAEDMEDW